LNNTPASFERINNPSSPFCLLGRRDFNSSTSASFGRASENTWNPPLSVIKGASRPMNACNPPASATSSGPGCNIR
jgi:hypothetical protein